MDWWEETVELCKNSIIWSEKPAKTPFSDIITEDSNAILKKISKMNFVSDLPLRGFTSQYSTTNFKRIHQKNPWETKSCCV